WRSRRLRQLGKSSQPIETKWADLASQWLPTKHQGLARSCVNDGSRVLERLQSGDEFVQIGICVAVESAHVERSLHFYRPPVAAGTACRRRQRRTRKRLACRVISAFTRVFDARWHAQRRLRTHPNVSRRSAHQSSRASEAKVKTPGGKKRAAGTRRCCSMPGFSVGQNSRDMSQAKKRMPRRSSGGLRRSRAKPPRGCAYGARARTKPA